jgi:tRNA (cmo5U34)-methyltransferase
LKLPKAGDWSFKDPHVAEHFDRHVREQLPWYDIATGIVTHIGRHYITKGGTVIDIGASTGNIARAISDTLAKRKARLIAIDNAADMLGKYSGPGEPIVTDARAFDYQGAEPDLIIAFLVFMFLPVPDRAALIERIKRSLRPGGALLVFDKMEARAGHVGSVIYRMTLAAKYEAGATPEEIIAKELSLAGVQRPMSDAELDGFVPIFRFGDFAGFLFEKPAKG